MTSYRLAAMAAAFLTLGSFAHATEIVILVNGNVMDVKSYEIKSQVVVVTTWDGKVQSFPLSWVDVDATRSVSHQYDPAAGIPAGKVEKSRELLEAYGVHDALSGLFEHVEGELRSIRSHVSRATYDVVLASFRNGYEGERIFDVAVAEFARGADEALLDRWARWLSLPDTARIVAMEQTELAGADDDEDKSRYLAELHSSPTASHRVELVTRIDESLRASEASLAIAATLAGSLQDSAPLVIADPPPPKDIAELREALWPTTHEATVDSLLFSYRAASDNELERYLAFWESEDGRRIAELMVTAIAAGVEYGAEMAVHNVRVAVGVPGEN